MKLFSQSCSRFLYGWGLLGIISGYASAAPVIVHQPPMAANENQAIAIEATINEAGVPVLHVKLFYRAVGSLGFVEQYMEGTAMHYSGRIPAPAVRTAGVEYYLEVRNQINERVTAPLLNASEAPYRIVIREAKNAPGLELLSPEDGATVSQEEAVVVVAIDPGKSQTDITTLQVFLDEQDVTKDVQKSISLISYVPPAGLALGLHGIRVSVRNSEAVEGKSPTWTFRVRAEKITPIEKNQAKAGSAHVAEWYADLKTQFQYAGLSQKPIASVFSLSQPEGWFNRMNLNLGGKAGDWKLLGLFDLTSEEKPGRQPVDRFRLELLNPGLEFSLGDVYPSFTDYSLSNLYLRGGWMRWLTGNPGSAHSELVLAGGLNQVAIAGDNVIGRLATFDRWVGGVRWLLDILPGTGLSLNSNGVVDNPNSVKEEERGGAEPVNNGNATGEAHLKIPWGGLLQALLYGEYGISYFDQELNLFTISLGQAYRGGMRWEWTDQNYLSVEYKHTGANYADIANPWLQTDWQGFSGKGRCQLLDNSLILMANLDAWQDNLEAQKDHELFVEAAGTTVTVGTTRTVMVSGNLNYRLPANSSLSLGYSLNRQADQTEPIKLLDNQTRVFNAGLGGQWPVGSSQVLGTVNYSVSRYEDLASEKNSGDFEMTSTMATLMWLMDNALAFSVGVGMNQNKRDESALLSLSSLFLQTGAYRETTDYQIMNVRGNWKGITLPLEFGLGWDHLQSRDDLKLVDTDLNTWLATSRYYFNSSHSLGCTISRIQYADNRLEANTYLEWVGNLQYRVRF